MKKIIFLNDWGENDQELLSRYSRQTPNDSGRWGNIEGTSDFNQADYYIIMDSVDNETLNKIDWSRVIYFQREPESIKPYFLGHDFPSEIFFNGTYEYSYNVPTWWINFSFNDLVKLPYPNKTKKISTVTSGAAGNQEHINRLSFLKKFTDKYKDIDVYGRGVEPTVGDCWRGELNYNGNCKFRGLIDYEYSLVLENILAPDTWTEKPSDAFLCWSLPIYWGCENMNEYFPEESYHQIDIDKVIIEDILDYMSCPPNKSQIEALREARNLLLFKWNIWPAVDKIIRERE